MTQLSDDHADAARWSGFLTALRSFLSFFCMPLLGAASDVLGRKVKIDIPSSLVSCMLTKQKILSSFFIACPCAGLVCKCSCMDACDIKSELLVSNRGHHYCGERQQRYEHK